MDIDQIYDALDLMDADDEAAKRLEAQAEAQRRKG